MIELIRQRRDGRQLAIGILVLAVLLVAGYFLWVSTALGHTLDNDAYFGAGESTHRVVKADREILDHITRLTLGCGLLILLGFALLRRRLLVGIVAVVGVVAAVAGAEVLKRVLPWSELVASDASLGAGLRAETYPSGHATIGTSVALAVLLVIPARWRPWGAVAAGMVSATLATAVVIGGWHRPSDAFGGVCWAGLVMGLAAVVSLRLQREHSPNPTNDRRARPLVGSLIAACCVYLALWVLAARSSYEYPDADLAFHLTMLPVVAAAFSVTAWFGDSLRGTDWTSSVGVTPRS